MSHDQQNLNYEEALLDPDKHFGQPKNVLRNDQLSREQKSAILRRWRYDAYQLQVAEGESMGGGEKIDIAEIDRVLELCQKDK